MSQAVGPVGGMIRMSLMAVPNIMTCVDKVPTTSNRIGLHWYEKQVKPCSPNPKSLPNLWTHASAGKSECERRSLLFLP